LTPKIIDPAKKLMAEMWPGVPVLPILQAGATDGRYLIAAGIPTYGIDGSFLDPELNHIHGLNEYAGVEPLYKDRDFLYRLVKLYAEGK
jgi:acetylornithine deacetylase/succinyl-diaminopimelate desuccinylase-like protein